MFDFNKYVSEFSNTVERRSVSGFRLLKEIANKLNAIVPNDECGIIVYNTWVHIDTRTKKYRKGV